MLERKRSIIIANAGGYWGDDYDAFREQIEGGKIDYLTLDYLAEVTMSILRKQQLKSPNSGYVPDIVQQIKENLWSIVSKKIKIITNAGGLNPIACGEKILEVLKNSHLDNQIKVGIVYGDNILENIHQFYTETFKNLDNPTLCFKSIQDKLQIANVYFGAKPIVEILKEGADIVITGRVTDASLVMAPMIYEFQWQEEDWNLLASSLVAGHLIECGTQVTGGNFTDWHLIKDWKLGYPIIEAFSDGTFIVKKHKNTGGIINPFTIKEQLLYEIDDPYNYISPDVIADFSTVNIEEREQDEILISNVKGKNPTPFYKVSMAYEDGYKVFGELIISGPKAIEKAKIIQEILEEKIASKNFYRYNVSYIGYNSCHKSLISFDHANEILLRFYAHDYDKHKLEEFSKKIPSIVLSAPAGISYTGGRPKTSEVLAFYPTLIKKESIKPQIMILNPEKKIFFSHYDLKHHTYEIQSKEYEESSSDKLQIPLFHTDDFVEVYFQEICLARSGDKGDHINLGIIARSKDIYDYLQKYLTADFIKYLFRDICKGKVRKYEIPTLNSFNFVLENSLEGGGTRSLQIDMQGKTIAQAFLNQKVRIPKHLLNYVKKGENI